MKESKAAMWKAEKDAERARREENKVIKRYNRAIDKLSCLTQKGWESPQAYGSQALKLLSKVDDDDERWVVKKFIKGINQKRFHQIIQVERYYHKAMTLAAAIARLEELYELADDTSYNSDSNSNSNFGNVDDEQIMMRHFIHCFRSDMLQSWSVVYDDEANINSQLQPEIEQTICGNAGNAEIDPAVPIRLCHGSDLALGKKAKVDNGEIMVTAREAWVLPM